MIKDGRLYPNRDENGEVAVAEEDPDLFRKQRAEAE